MIIGLDTFVKIKPHPSSSIIKSIIYQAMTNLIFVGKVSKLGGGNLGNGEGGM